MTQGNSSPDFVLVPREPTEEMLAAGFDAVVAYGSALRSGVVKRQNTALSRIYEAMLAAAQMTDKPEHPVWPYCAGSVEQKDGGNMASTKSRTLTTDAAVEREGDLKVWWIPQVPMKPFEVPVASVREAQMLLDVLAKYDAFQFENRIKPDYCNAGGLVRFEDGEWCEWEDADGNDVDHTQDGRLWEPPPSVPDDAQENAVSK